MALVTTIYVGHIAHAVRYSCTVKSPMWKKTWDLCIDKQYMEVDAHGQLRGETNVLALLLVDLILGKDYTAHVDKSGCIL